MMKADIFRKIEKAIEAAPAGMRTAEMHLQMIKYSEELRDLSGREFCEAVGIGPSFATEFSKMKNITERVQRAGLDVTAI